jgi:hypothetical protein
VWRIGWRIPWMWFRKCENMAHSWGVRKGTVKWGTVTHWPLPEAWGMRPPGQGTL